MELTTKTSISNLNYQSKTAHTIFWWLFFLLSRRQYQYTIKPRHIRHLLGTYIPNDEYVSLYWNRLQPTRAGSATSQITPYGSANYEDYLRRLVPKKITNCTTDRRIGYRREADVVWLNLNGEDLWCKDSLIFNLMPVGEAPGISLWCLLGTTNMLD